jgi:hypothetical protein
VIQEILLGARLGSGTDVESSVTRSPRVRLCHDWERHAVREAHRVRTRRAVLAGDEDRRSSARPQWTWIDHVPFLSSLSSNRSLLLFSVPLTDDNGAVLELHIIALRVDGAFPPAPPHRLIEVAREAASRSAGARLRRLERLRAQETIVAIERERALCDAVVAPGSSRERQPGLFDRREAREAERDQDLAAELRRELDMRVLVLQRGARLHVDRPALELVLLAR